MTGTLTRAKPHPFVLDAGNIDPYEQVRRARLGLPPRRWCRVCGLPGLPGDRWHRAAPGDDLRAAWREHDLAVLGERD